MQSLELESPSKLNLMLHITGRRDDGYHLLQTVFQLIDLSDRMKFEVTRDAEICRANSNTPVAEADDISLRAAQLLQSRYQVNQGVRISIDKRIPVGGGLGGGSSNAATTLLALNKLWQLGLDKLELGRLGLELGADVPVFVAGKSAWATGIGEQLEPLELPESWFLVIQPEISVSTAEIFSAEELTRNCDAITIRAFLEGESRNVCEPVARRLYPEIGKAIDWLGQYASAKMTGTGACIFASFGSLEQAESVKSLAPENWRTFVTRAINESNLVSLCE